MKFKSDIEVQAGLRDGGNDIGTVGQLLSSTGSVTNWIDQSEVVAAGATRVLVACKNTSGGTITKGTPVYQTGNVGATDVIEIDEANALMSAGHLPAIGLLEADLTNNAFGHVVITGELLNITTSPIDGVTPTTGDTIYLKSGGGLTLTKPTGEGNAIQNLGLIGKVSGGNSGSITVASIMRQNDVPNLPTGKIWIGDGNTIVSDTVYVDEPNNRFGIGTTSPSQKLEVNGNIEATGFMTSGVSYSRFSNDAYIHASSGNDIVLGGGIGGYQNDIVISGGVIKASSTGNHYFSNGNVGIGTTSPAAQLEINDASAPFMRFGRAASYWWEIGHTSSDFQFNSATGGTIMHLEYNGNVGIGTVAPSQKLEVVGVISSGAGAGASNLGMDFGGLSDPASMPSQVRGVIGALNSGTGVVAGSIGYQPRVGVNAAHIFFTGQTEKMRIDHDGNVGIGTTSPQEKLHVQNYTTGESHQAMFKGGAVTVGDYAYISLNNGYGAEYTKEVRLAAVAEAGASNKTGFAILTSPDASGASGHERLRVTNDGNVGIGTTSPGSKLQVDGGIQMADDTDAASASKVGTLRYRTSGNNSYVDMCMQTAASTYAWVNIVQNTW